MKSCGSADCAGAWSPKVLRAGQGAHFAATIHENADLPGFGGFTAVPPPPRRWPMRYRSTRRPGRAGGLGFRFGRGRGVAARRVGPGRVENPHSHARAGGILNVGAAAAICLFETRCAGGRLIHSAGRRRGEVNHHEGEHRFAVLVDRPVTQAGDAAIRLGGGGAGFEHLDFAVQGIPGRTGASQRSSSIPGDPMLDPASQAALDEKPETQCQGLEAMAISPP